MFLILLVEVLEMQVLQVKSKTTAQPRYSGVAEDVMRKANAIWEENKQLKKN